jgi:Ca-activated chloride channel family protein
MAMRPGGPSASSAFEVDTNLVLINALVTDGRGTPIRNIQPSQFHIFEGGKEQPINFCAREDGPASIGIVLDASGSMGAALEYAQNAVGELLRRSNPLDEYFLVTFQDHPTTDVPFTKDLQLLTSAVGSLSGKGSTALVDALYLAGQQVQRARYPKRAILVISDGADNHSRYTLNDVKRMTSEMSCPIFTVGLRSPWATGNRFSIQRRDVGILEAISRFTGGKNFTVFDLRRLDSIVGQIASEIRSEYLLGYVAPSSGGQARRVQIKVDPEIGRSVRIEYRQTYLYR